MKVCPLCKSNYEDWIDFCFNDGIPLQAPLPAPVLPSAVDAPSVPPSVAPPSYAPAPPAAASAPPGRSLGLSEAAQAALAEATEDVVAPAHDAPTIEAAPADPGTAPRPSPPLAPPAPVPMPAPPTPIVVPPPDLPGFDADLMGDLTSALRDPKAPVADNAAPALPPVAPAPVVVPASRPAVAEDAPTVAAAPPSRAPAAAPPPPPVGSDDPFAEPAPSGGSSFNAPLVAGGVVLALLAFGVVGWLLFGGSKPPPEAVAVAPTPAAPVGAAPTPPTVPDEGELAAGENAAGENAAGENAAGENAAGEDAPEGAAPSAAVEALAGGPNPSQALAAGSEPGAVERPTTAGAGSTGRTTAPAATPTTGGTRTGSAAGSTASTGRTSSSPATTTTTGAGAATAAVVEAEVRESRGVLRVISEPDGATVYIDDAPKGRTPLAIELPYGSYRVQVTHAGYKQANREASLQVREYTVPFQLEPEATTGQINLFGPMGYRVEVDGRDAGTMPVTVQAAEGRRTFHLIGPDGAECTITKEVRFRVAGRPETVTLQCPS